MKSILIFFLLLLSPQLWAGGTSIGNGGGAVVCRDSAGAIKSASVLDLYEGFALYGLGYNELQSAPEDQARAFIPVIETLFAGVAAPHSFLDPLNSIIERMHLLPPGVGLENTGDFGAFIIPKTCEMDQAINYRDDGEIFTDSDIWNHYSKTHRAAAYIHELIYEYARAYGAETTSLRVRRLVSLLFAGKKLDPILAASLKEKCMAKSSTFFTSQNSDGSIQLLFTSIAGHAALSRISAVAPATGAGPFSSGDHNLTLNLKSEIDRGFSIHIESLGSKGTLTINDSVSDTQEPFHCELLN